LIFEVREIVESHIHKRHIGQLIIKRLQNIFLAIKRYFRSLFISVFSATAV